MVTTHIINGALRLVHFRKEKNKIKARLFAKDNRTFEECYVSISNNTNPGKQKFTDSIGREQVLTIPMGL